VIVRRVGVEEELLLTDAVSGELRPLAREVIAACEARGGADKNAERVPRSSTSSSCHKSK